ncbi:MAG: winged helix-turn-helix transcriptional regulator [Kiritimatiellaeota bacterium]|nr:winged helix-turn-helix transcriptional regulator [Kiritimatiellota bacterium]
MEEFLDAFEALANENRIKIFKFLLDPCSCSHVSEEERRTREVCVCNIVKCFDLAESTVSHHLACLRRGKLIKCEKRGKWIFYSIDWDGVERFKAVIAQTMRSG